MLIDAVQSVGRFVKVTEITERVAKVLSDETIELEYSPEDEYGKKQTGIKEKLRLRKVCYQGEKNRYYEFLTNNFEIPAEEVAYPLTLFILTPSKPDENQFST